MARLGRTGFLAVAALFHVIYIWSIFDVYFVSPIVSGMQAYKVEGQEAPAKRLVLFVGDGLRADKAFQSFPDPSPSAANSTSALTPRPLAPFLRSRVLSHGTFGVSHTRVPTESRPGHVALIAGLYEDVSAVMTGWKLNPVNFDSVFNRSRHTWSWGSPDILPMFKEGAVPGRVYADTYGHEFEDFTQDATMLDTWVFDKVKGLFEEAGHNKTLDEELRKDKNVFFLHLLGLDTTGHAFRPYSREYLHNIQVVDKGVQEVAETIEEFYGDGKTAFVFTADHGMSDWGSHGDGHPDNTRTPLVAWGAGVAKPVINPDGKAAGHEDGFSSDWGFETVQRNDVSQADIAALMAYLAGLEFPVNSVGELPLSYLAANSSGKADAMLVNAQEILEMYRVKEERKKSTELRYKPFAPLGDSEHSADSQVAQIQSLIQSKSYDEAIVKSTELISTGLGGLRYLQTYNWLFLRTLVTAGYLGWIAFAVTTVVDLHVLHGKTETSRSTISVVAFMSVFIALCSILAMQRSALSYYAYAVFPCVFWEEVYARKTAISQGSRALLGHIRTGKDYFRLGLSFLACVGLLEALVQSYHHREIYSVCYIAAIAWPFFYGKDFIARNEILAVQWGLCCAVMACFTLLPAMKVESLPLILIGGVLMFTAGMLFLMYEGSFLSRSKSTRINVTAATSNGFSRGILGVQVGLVGLAMLVTRSSVVAIQSRRGLPLGTQIVGWVVLLSSLIVPFLHSLQPNKHYLHRLVVIFLAFAPIFIILTISYEGLFYFTFCLTLVTWVRMEHHIFVFSNPPATIAAASVAAVDYDNDNNNDDDDDDDDTEEENGNNEDDEDDDDDEVTTSETTALAPPTTPPYRALTLTDARTTLFFLFLLQSAFFSTGNIASVSSFSLDAVYRLIPVFDPFSQAALLLLKLLTPFAYMSANLGILNRRLGVAPSALFMLVIAVSDVLTLNFFYMVRDEGSWLDIGTSISHFFIASLLCVFVAGLEFVSEVLVSGVEFEEEGMVGKGEVVGKKGPKGLLNGKGKSRKRGVPVR